MPLAYLFAGGHSLVLTRWYSLPFWFRAAALFWALQAINRVAWMDHPRGYVATAADRAWLLGVWVPLERCVLALTVCAVVEAACALHLPTKFWSFQVRMGLLLGGFAFGAAVLYFMHAAAGLNDYDAFIFLRTKIKAAAAFLAFASAFVGVKAGVEGGHAFRFALAALLATGTIVASTWTTPQGWRDGNAIYRTVAIGCCGVWIFGGKR